MANSTLSKSEQEFLDRFKALLEDAMKKFEAEVEQTRKILDVANQELLASTEARNQRLQTRIVSVLNDTASDTWRRQTESIHKTADEIGRTIDSMCDKIANIRFPEPIERERQYHRVYGHGSVSGPRSKKRRPF